MFLLIPNYTDGIFRKGSSYGKPNKFDSRCKQRMCLRAARVARMTGFYLTEEHRPPFLELGCEDDRGPRRSIRCPRYDCLSPAQTLAQTKIIKTKYLIFNIKIDIKTQITKNYWVSPAKANTVLRIHIMIQ